MRSIILANTYHSVPAAGTRQLIRRFGGLITAPSPVQAPALCLRPDSGGFQVFQPECIAASVSEEGVKFRSHLDGSTPLFLLP